MSDISNKVLEEIKEKNISPTPGWFFEIKNILMWLLFITSSFIGGLAISIIIFLLANFDWEIYPMLAISQVRHAMMAIPYFWVMSFLLLIIFAYYNFKNTKTGYRYALAVVVLTSFILSLFLGMIFYLSGVSEDIHEFLCHNIPIYNTLIYDHDDIWRFPERGLLAGEITDINNAQDFYIRDLMGRTWHIVSNGALIDCAEVSIGSKIKIEGRPLEDSNFSSVVIMSWAPCPRKK